MKKYALFLLILTLLFTSCGSGVSAEKLYGKWKYINVENPRANPPTKVPDYELKAQAPYIEFLKDNTAQIVWGGKVLSHGTFTVDGSNIHFKEILPGGQVREFPFFISGFTGKDMVFETLGVDGTKVTAVKQ
jgi:hypothetical protein